MKRVFVIFSAVACFAGAAVSASASPTPKGLWATVNLCDTPVHDNMMGIRGSMPGDAGHTKMYMRFIAQYYDRTHQLWSEAKHGVSGWIYVGSGDYARREAGYTFAFNPPMNGMFTMRGAVDFKWTKGKRIVRTAHVITKGGHPNTKGADPKDYTKALCEIS
jgi:hypothetical protein